MTWHVVEAAAGTGKTVELAKTYLKHLKDGIPVERIVAITFTRKAAAELIERVSQVLYALLADRSLQSDDAVRKLGDELHAYDVGGWTDKDRIRQALAELGAAPIGTTDSFVQKLLAEFALDARLPVGPDLAVALDFPLAAGGDAALAFEEEARALLESSDPLHRSYVEPLLAHYTQAKLLELVTRPHPLDGRQAATIHDVFDALVRQLVTKFAVTDLRGALTDGLGLAPEPSRWGTMVAFKDLNKGGVPAAPAVLAWLRGEGDDAIPDAFVDYFGALDPEIRRLGAPENAGAEVAAFIERATGETAGAWIVRELGLGQDPAVGLAALIKPDKVGAEVDVARWLADGGVAPPSLSGFRTMLRDLKATKGVQELLKKYRDTPEAIWSRIQRRTGAVTAAEWLRVTLRLHVPADRWVDVLRDQTNAPGKDAARAVAEWLAAPEQVEAPGELIPVLLHQTGKLRAPLFRRLLGLPPIETGADGDAEGDPVDGLAFSLEVDGSTVHVPLAALATAEGAFFRPAVMAEAEAVRGHIEALRAEVTRRGLTRAAKEGALGYEELLAAATSLCRSAAAGGEPRALRDRFDALLVDEVQDSSPAQIALYRALAETNPDMRCFFVGDSRQSIYLFRGAAPAGMAELAKGEGASLRTNYRSTKSLVRTQRELFGERLRDVMRASRLEPLDALDGLEPYSRNAEGLAAPVTLVLAGSEDGLKRNEVDVIALQVFAKRMAERWAAEKDLPPEKQCTAAVLAPTWKLATAATELLRGQLGPAAAFLDGGGGWLAGRVVRDLRLILAALLDRGDQMAWLGVWKHPMVGLSDRALALIRTRRGVLGTDGAAADGWQHHLGWVLEAEALDGAVHDAADVEAFARARDPLRRAAGAAHSRGAAEVLEALARELRWREVLAASPRDDDLAHLEVALDWLRDLDQSGISPTDILDQLSGDANGTEAPRIEVHRPSKHISCTTVFQAKGLKWTHVCVLSPGVGPMGGAGADSVTAVISGRAFRLEPVRVDPRGAFEEKTDPTGRLLSAVESQRKRAECLRIAYVGVTRAKASVVLGLPTPAGDGVQRELCDAWASPRSEEDGTVPALPGVEVLYIAAPDPVSRPPCGWAEPRHGARLTDVDERRHGWLRQAPSRVEAAVADPGMLALDIARRVLDAGGLRAGDGGWIATPSDAVWKQVGQDTWGTLVHGWFAKWQFQGAPAQAEIAAWLDEEWGDSHPDLVDWLTDVTKRVRSDVSSPLWQLVSDPDAQLHFELPIVGVMGFDDDPSLLLSGRADLLVRSPGRPVSERWTVIDFKAGEKHPGTACGAEQLVSEASLKTYGPQLEAYRRMLNRAFDASAAWRGERVGDVALWFVRAGASVVWRSL